MTRALDRRNAGEPSLRRITDALTLLSGSGRQSGKWVKFRCPTHDDQNPSLAVRYDAAKGRTHLRCFGPCDDTTVLAALNLTVRDLFDDPDAAAGGRQPRKARSSNGLVDLADRRPAKPSTPEPATDRPAKTKRGDPLGPVVATYSYTDADGSLVGRVQRHDPKTFRPQTWNPETRRWSRRGFRPVLYRLPQVAAAIAAGDPVYVVEGEKDADTAVTHYGVAGTCNASGGAVGHFLAEHADQLRGARVVIVADRDETGYGHAIEVTDRLTGIAASVHTVRARIGKDLSDHHAAGHGLDELEEIDPRAELRLITGGKDGGGGVPPTGGDGGGHADDEIPNYEPKYLYRQGKTVRVDERRKPGDPARYQVVWHCEVSVLDELVDDDGDPETNEPVRGAVRLGLRRWAREPGGDVAVDENGQRVWESTEVLLPAERINDGTWPDCLPWPRLLHNRGRKAKDDALEAAQMVVAGPWRMSRQYVATGWREEDGRWRYIHAGGAITVDGLLPLTTVSLPAAIKVINPGWPTSDVDQLRADVGEGFDRLIQLPARIVAPLVGFAFRGLLSPPQTSIHLAGLRGTGKTAIARCAVMHWVAPAMHEDGISEMSSGRDSRSSGFGDSAKGLAGNLHVCADAPYLIDDYKGRASMQKLEDVQTSVWNGGAGTLRTRTGGRRNEGKPRAAVITTGEKATSGSAATRALTIELNRGDLGPSMFDLFTKLESRAAREARGRLGASFLRWVAGRRPELMSWLTDLETDSTYTHAWRQIASTLDHDDGVQGRLARIAMRCTSGWIVLLTYLRRSGVITDERADELWTWAMTGITEQLTEQDPTATDGPRQMLDLLRSALAAGTCHLSDKAGQAPSTDNPADRVSYGWAPRTAGTGTFHDPDQVWMSRGDRIGFLTDTHLYLMPPAVMAVITAAAARSEDPFSETAFTLGADMAARGWITPNRNREKTSTHRVGGVVGRYWVLPRAVLDDYGHDGDGPGSPRPPLPPAPWRPPQEQPAPEPTTSAAEEADPSSDPPVAPVDDDAVVAAFELHAQERPCVVCSEPTTGQLNGRPMHLPCANTTPAAAPPPAPATSAAPPAGSRPVERPAPVASTRQRMTAAWCYSTAVVDPAGVYLPDGTVGAPRQVRNIADLATIGDEYRIGHTAGAGLIVLTTAMVERLGMMPDTATMRAPNENGGGPTEDDIATRIIAHLADHTALLNNPDGWTADRGTLAPWTRIRRGDRSVQIVFEPFVWVWDRRPDSASPFLELPGDDTDPARWQELARRLGRLGDLLGMPWSTSPGTTGAAIFDQIQRHRGRTGGRVLTTAGALPDLTGTGQVRLEAEYAWGRRPAAKELDAAGWVHCYDRRGSYLAAAGGADLGYGDPDHFTGTAAADLISSARGSRTKLPFGLWLLTLPAWDESMPPPHPDQQPRKAVTRWVTTASLTLLTDPQDSGGAGYDLADLGLIEAWVWPGQARFLEPWYKRCREALIAARGGDDAPVARAIKGVYTGYVGRLASSYTARSARPWHHQPAWEATIRALARGGLWRAMQRHHLATGKRPAAIDHDEVAYLSTDPDPGVEAPARDNGRLGALKPSRHLELTDDVRRLLTQGARATDHALWPNIENPD